MSVVLPKELAYAPSLPSLPECSSKEIVLSAVNGNSFVAGNLVQWDFPQQGFLDPASLYIRYRVSVPQVATNSYIIKKLPVYTLIQKLEVLFGSQVVETINDYNVWTNLWSDLQLDVAQRYGSATSLGQMGNSTYANTSLAEASDGALLVPANVTTQNFSLSAPLPCILSGAEKLVPLGMMPQVRLQLTLESIANAFVAASGTNQLPTSVTFSNMELCYTSVDFGGEVQEMVKSMGDKIYIKSQSVSAMGNNVSVASVGTLDLIYNQRLASVKSLFATFCPITANGTTAVNGKLDSIDITSANGSLVFNIAGVNYPQREISTLYNKSSVMTELRKACGALHADAFFPCIGRNEFNALDSAPPASELMIYTQAGGAIGATPTSATNPAKFYFGVNTEKLTTNGVLLSGISTQSAPISLRINLGTATTYGYNVSVFALYDALIEVSPLMRDASVKQ
jgi:hypothetical protein